MCRSESRPSCPYWSVVAEHITLLGSVTSRSCRGSQRGWSSTSAGKSGRIMQHDSSVCARNSVVLPSEIGYARPSSLSEALTLLASNEGARVLAGGQTLLNVMKARAASPEAVVDLGALEELRGIELGTDGSLDIGAMTTI